MSIAQKIGMIETASQELIVLIGIPGSGKSTFRKKYYPEYELISLDVLHSRQREAAVLRQALAARKNCVIDNTNVSVAERAMFIEAGKNAGYRIVGYYLRSIIAECLKRNAMRCGKMRIPDAGVIGRAARLELPKYSEGFDELHYVAITDDGFAISDWREDDPCEK